MTTESSQTERLIISEALINARFNLALPLGYGLRGQENFGHEAVVSFMSDNLKGAESSVCGVKGFMVDELRQFFGPGKVKREIRCASVAMLEITDSPVHFHLCTLEMYAILSGEGKMVLDGKIVDVKTGNVILIPPGVHHGLLAKDPNAPVRVLMTFTPGLAPKDEPIYRDEYIVSDATSQHIKNMTN